MRQKGGVKMDVQKFKAMLVERGVKPADMAKLLNIDISTYYRKVQKNKFLIEEVQLIVDKLCISNSDAIEIFLDKKSQICDK